MKLGRPMNFTTSHTLFIPTILIGTSMFMSFGKGNNDTRHTWYRNTILQNSQHIVIICWICIPQQRTIKRCMFMSKHCKHTFTDENTITYTNTISKPSNNIPTILQCSFITQNRTMGNHNSIISWYTLTHYTVRYTHAHKPTTQNTPYYQ